MFSLRNSMDTYVRETHKIMHGHQSTPQFVGMTGSYPTSILDLLCDEDPLSDASSTGDNYLEGASAPRCLCALSTAESEPPPHVESSQATHRPLDQHAQVLANAQAHAHELRPKPEQTPPLANPPPRPHSEPKGGNSTRAARQRARGVNHDIVNVGAP